MKKLLLIIVLGIGLSGLDGVGSELRAQNFSLQPYPVDQLNDPVEQILQFFGAISGAGFVTTANLHSFGGLDIGVRIVGAIVPDAFDAVLPISGLPTSNQVPGPFQGENVLGFPFLTASLGLFSNVEVMGRVFSYPLGNDPTRGNVTLVGGGIKYGLLQAPMLPKIVLIGAYQALLVPDEFDFGTVRVASAKAFASQDLAILTVYGGAGVDKTFLTVRLPGVPDNSFDATNTHGTVGLTATVFPFVRVNGEYNFGTFDSFTIGASLSIR